ncbi:glucose-methanol-choline oxidoreductase [Isoalcanivorax pacificus W11-5]|uniref:Glucose-methanol-choline oxidoreductase n=1 Tax=Isoalcanivorax pacificus W11-5 TaxID=391936 RepID=A0A0B4XJ19_9GAMM|nr:GMC family oxidoreductase [Isoalcanivorax pacificus]AJD48294.1 glucose-methanol-choline oxidoreductase [Isoalcanivorax pacificus W11-5]
MQPSRIPRYDYLIVGSGAGGSPLACYLAAAGKRVLLIEAGRAWQSEQYPDNEFDASLQLMWNGGVEPSSDGALALLRGRALGGGTVVNQCLLDRFDEVALQSWAQRSGIDAFSLSGMQRHYDITEQHLSLEMIREQDWNGNARLYVDGFEKLGYGWAPLRRGQRACDVHRGNDCIRCLGGCPRDAKQSMPVTFLPLARQHGVEIITECEIDGLVHGAQGVTLYGRRQGERVQYHGAHAVLAAGSLGSTRILLNSGLGDALPALGQGFYCHPQFVTFGVYDRIIDAHRGSFQAVKSDDPRFRAAGFKLENVFVGPMGAAYLVPGFGRQHLAAMAEYRHLACIEVAVRDVTPGRISVQKNGRLKVDKRLSAEERRRARAGLNVIQDIYRATGARRVIESPVHIGLHLMGGCALGTQRAQSVVNPEFAVHGMPRLHVVDGSLFPDAPGINPSLTIMALAHRAAEALLGGDVAPVVATAPRMQETA